MKPSELEEMPLRIEKLYYDLQNRIMTDVVRRIKKTGCITSTADYQLQKIQILGGSTEYIESEIQRMMDLSDSEIWELYDKAAEQEYTRDKALYEQINGKFIPYSDNEILQSWTQAVVKQTLNDIKNISRSLGMMVSIGEGKSVFTPLAEYYQRYLDRACLDVVTGSFSYNTVLRRVVKEMSVSGIRSVDYATGWSNRVPVAVRRAVMTGVNQLAGQINEKVADDLKTNDFEVTWHFGARPDHWWGGMVFSKEELYSVCHLGEVTGLCGANCRHSYIPFLKGISVRAYTDDQLAEMNAKEKETHTWAGKEYNTYEATQKQRQMETVMRAQRSKIDLLKKGGADQGDIISARCRYQTSLHQYQGFCSKMELKPQMERVYMDGLGRVATPWGKAVKTVDKLLETAIIKEKKMYRKKKSIHAIEPMPKMQLQKIVRGFKRKGGIIQMDEATDAYLSSKNAEAISLNHNTILLHRNPGRAAVFEELIHATQWRNGRNDGSLESRLLCEIEAQEKLLQCKKVYKLTDAEVGQTRKALKDYKDELEMLRRGGG